MRQRNRLALGALAAAIVAIAAGAGVYAMRGSDEPSVLHQSEQGTPQADASRQATPGSSSAASAACLAGSPDCNDTGPQPDAELTCEEAGACAEPAQMYECIEPQDDAPMPCAAPCAAGGGPAENVRCFPPEPCGPAPEPGDGGGGVAPIEPGDGGGITPVEPPSGEPPADAPTPCVPPSLPPDCTISSDGAIACPDNPPPDDSGPAGSEPGSPGVAPPPVVATAVAQ